jgi:hypothetical protein
MGDRGEERQEDWGTRLCTLKLYPLVKEKEVSQWFYAFICSYKLST